MVTAAWEANKRIPLDRAPILSAKLTANSSDRFIPLALAYVSACFSKPLSTVTETIRVRFLQHLGRRALPSSALLSTARAPRHSSASSGLGAALGSRLRVPRVLSLAAGRSWRLA